MNCLRSCSAFLALPFVFLLLFAGGVSGQEEEEQVLLLTLPDNFIDARSGVVKVNPSSSDAPLPGAGYDRSPVNGVFVQSEDGEFRLQVGAYTQIRWNANFRDAPPGPDMTFGDADSTTGWSLNRTRVFFEGRYTEDFAYHLRTNTDAESNTELLVAWGQYRISDRWHLRFGKQFIPLSREDWMYAQDLLTIEFSPNDSTFSIGPSLGAFLNYQGDQHRFWISGHNGAFGGRESFPQPESDVAATVRHEWMAEGEDWGLWNDLVGRPGRSEGTLVGWSLGYQTGKRSNPGGRREGAQGNLDLSFSGNGYQALVSGSATWVDPAGQVSSMSYGALAQLGIFLAPRHQVYGQYNWIGPGSTPGELESFHSVAAGYNFLPFEWTNRWKFSCEVGHMFGALDSTLVAPSGALGWFPSEEDGQTYLKLQAQLGF